MLCLFCSTFLAFLVATFCAGVSSEIFTAMADVEPLLHVARESVSTLKVLVEVEKQRLAHIQDHLRQYTELRSSFVQAYDNSTIQIFHPAGCFRLIKVLAVEWQRLRSLLLANLGTVGAEEVDRFRSTVPIPSTEDVHGAAEAILRLQHTYNLDEQHIAAGRLTGVQAITRPLTSSDCFVLGHSMGQLNFHHDALKWLRISLQLHEREAIEKLPALIKRTVILDWLQYSTYRTGDVVKALAITQKMLQLDPEFPSAQENTDIYKKLLDEMFNKTHGINETVPPEVPHFPPGNLERLCRGEALQPPRNDFTLRCYLEFHGNPFLRLQPIKTEVVNAEPDIYVLHDVLLASQVERLKRVAHPYLQRALVVKPGTAEFEPARIRISKSAFLKDDIDPVVFEINERLGLATNLDPDMAEDLQVANYGIGGHYDAHFDHFRTVKEVNQHQINPFTGDRIATVLLYLSDVDAGGATVFPRINLTLYPEKGSAAFWYNLHRDGLGDENVLHSGCPVLAGNKWISNKWIRERWQDRTRPCGLHPDSPEWPQGTDRP